MDIEAERKLLAQYPFHIYLMTKALKKALDEGRAVIQDGMPVFKKDSEPGDKNKAWCLVSQFIFP